MVIGTIEGMRTINNCPQQSRYNFISLWEPPTFFFLYLVCEGIGTAATPGLLCQPRVIMKMIVEKQMECKLAGETEVLGENLPRRHFCPSQNPTWPDPGLNPGRRGGKPTTNRLSYGAALTAHFNSSTGQSRRGHQCGIESIADEALVDRWRYNHILIFDTNIYCMLYST
jgi:hypothetical protein